MSLTVTEFWPLLVASRLATPAQCAEWNQAFGSVKGASQSGNARTLAQWLIAEGHITRFQSTILLAGSTGPFFYGEYCVQERIEAGRLANWFHAVHTPTRHPVLLQFLAGPASQDRGYWSALVARSIAQSTEVHPLLHRLYEPVDLAALKMIVWEDLDGRCIADILMQAGRSPPAEVARIGWQTAIAIAFLHQQGKVHGDIRPANLFLDSQGYVRVFREAGGPLGAVNLAHADPSGLTEARADYLAPEFMQAGKHPDMLTDIYALGCTLYHMVAGQAPFAGGELSRKLVRHATEPIQPLMHFGIAPQLAQVITMSMAKNAGIRIPNIIGVVEQLAPLVDPGWLSAPPPARRESLLAYEQWIRQKQLTQAAQAPVATPHQPQYGTAQGIKAAAVESPIKKIETPEPAAVAVTTAGPVLLDNIKPKTEEPDSFDGVDPKKVWTYAGIAAILLIALLIAVNYGFRPGEDPTSKVESPRTKPDDDLEKEKKVAPPPIKSKNPPPTKSNGPTVAGPVKITLVSQGEADWQTLPWASPSSGSPISLLYAPPEAIGYIVVAPKFLATHAEGANVMKAIEGRLGESIKQLGDVTGIPFPEMEQLIIGIHPHETEPPRYSFVVRLAASIPEADLLAKWGNPQGVEFSGDGNSAMLYSVKGLSIQIPPEGKGRVFVMGRESDIQEGVKLRNQPLLSKEMQRLLDQSDASRMATIVVDPRRLFGDGRKLFSDDRSKLLEPLEKFLGDDILAASLSFHVTDHFYWEARLYSTLDRTPQQMATEFRQRIDSIPRQVLDYAASIDAHPYWKKLYLNFPQMIQSLQRNTRVGVEEKTVLVNGVLPLAAASNLTLASELALASSSGGAIVVNSKGGSKKATNYDEALALKVSYSFPAQSLEFAVAGLAEEANTAAGGFPVRMKILGNDLQLDGITRNQAIRDFKAENMTVADVLTALVRKGNPITTVKDPSEADQKLVWVVGPDPDDESKQMILVTTRAAVEKKKFKLPPAFVLKK